MGDFTDLRDFARLAASLGAGIVGLNPLHALDYGDPNSASPYSPVSRYFLNPIYLDVEAIPEFRAPGARAAALRAQAASPGFAATLAALRAVRHVDYAGVARVKWWALEELYEILCERAGPRYGAFQTFARHGGERLERFALHQALAERFAVGGRSAWQRWPPRLRAANAASLDSFAARHRRRVDYFKYLQFAADAQLRDARRAAGGMSLGLYCDLAVGANRNGADVWSDRAAYCLNESIGAPPDELGPAGQDWGLPPLDPRALLREGGAGFTDLLRANMRHAGALRLDHVMALARVFRIPLGAPPRGGGYVAYPFEELLALLSAASRAAKCAVIGEDLGTVPAGFRERIQREGILSYRLLLFERDASGAFSEPAAYPRLSLATATTHDLPTLPGWAAGCDIALREALGIAPRAGGAARRKHRRGEVLHLLHALRASGELDRRGFQRARAALDGAAGEPGASAPLVAAAYRYLARTPARVVLVQLDDALGELDQVNVPGTTGEYPNWRRKVSRDLESLTGDETIARLAREIDERLRPPPAGSRPRPKRS